MRLQKIIIPETLSEGELFFRGKTEIMSDEILTFDTYYNSFSYTKYREYTNVSEIEFRCIIRGRAKMQLCLYDGKEKVLCETIGNGNLSLCADITTLPHNGFLYPKITALTDCEFITGEYCSNCTFSNIKCCIAICTFKREQYVLRNIEILRNNDFSFIEKVFVIDNGNTLDGPSLSDEKIKILPNINYGGSGGFTRGLIEAYDNGYSHVILMDDDVEFYPETLEQMTVFMSLLKEEYKESWFSAAMIPLDKQWEQFELGARWSGTEAKVYKHRADVRKLDVLLDNLVNSDVEYGGWWTLCMPVSIVYRQGLPYPFFIKFDDTEYGMRKSEDVPIITMNGIAIRHEAFDKKASFVLDYYNLRNELIVNSIYGKYGTCGILKRFWYEICKHLVLYRYDNIPLILRAANDFLGGVDFFLRCDEEALNTELYATAPKLVSLKQIPQWNESLRRDNMVRNKNITFAMLITFGGHIIPSFALNKTHSAAPLSRIGAVDTFRNKEIIQYQLGADVGIITKRSFAKFIKYSFLAFGTSLKLLFLSGKVRKNYQSRKTELTSMDFWRTHLNI